MSTLFGHAISMQIKGLSGSTLRTGPADRRGLDAARGVVDPAPGFGAGRAQIFLRCYFLLFNCEDQLMPDSHIWSKLGLVFLLVAISASVAVAADKKRDQAWDLSRKAEELEKNDKFAEAIELNKQALALREKTLGPVHDEVADSLFNIAWELQQLARYADAEAYYRRAISVKETQLKASPKQYGIAAMLANYSKNLATLYSTQHRYDEAEHLVVRALDLQVQTLGNDSTNPVADAQVDLAYIYISAGRYEEAETAARRALAVHEKVFGPGDSSVSEDLELVASTLVRQNRFADADPLLQRALTIYEKDAERRRGKEALSDSRFLRRVGTDYTNMKRYSDAEPLLKRAVAAAERNLAPDRFVLSSPINSLGILYFRQERYSEAIPLFERAVAIAEKNLGAVDTELTSQYKENLAKSYRGEGRFGEALALEQRQIAIRRATAYGALPVLFGAEKQALIPFDRALDASLDVIQNEEKTPAAQAVAKLGLRLAAGNDRLAELVRKDQDLATEAEAQEKAIVSAIGKDTAERNAAKEQQIKGRIVAIDGERKAIQARYASEFPQYGALANPVPLTARDIQSLLADSEAMVVFSTLSDKETDVFVLSKDAAVWKTIPFGGDVLARKVAAFRRGLDVGAVTRGFSRTECTEAEAAKRGFSRLQCNEALTSECATMTAPQRSAAGTQCAADGDTRTALFDLGKAHDLYVELFGPIEDAIHDKRELLIVPSGALTSLPFHLLAATAPTSATSEATGQPSDFSAYRNADWLIKSHAISILPSISSLRALRGVQRQASAGKPMIGFGDPVFDTGADKPADAPRVVAASITRSYSDFWKGASIDRDQLAQALPRLPDTAIELQSVAASIGAQPQDVLLGAAATETAVKQAPLSDYRVVYFATHGLVAGDVKGVGEPSLALSVPRQPTDLDDGLLTSSEVAQLKLNADWVVLSACNTIAGDTPGAEALSGLARAFFYSGTRALLVSHWAVSSNAAVRLTTSTFGQMAKNEKLSRAAALRQAMLDYMNDTSIAINAYPAFWAPFVIVGDSGLR